MPSSDLSRLKAIGARIRPITKISISEEIAQQIMDLISDGHLKAGQRLPSERELCKNFGCGRSSLREALRCLSIVGVLDARVGEGTSIAVDGSKFLGKIIEWRIITEKHDIENLLEVRIALEGISARKAAALRNHEDLAKLQQLINKMESATGDAKRFAALDLDFHIALAKAANNTLLYDLITMIRGQLVRALSTVLMLPQAPALSLKEHVSIFNAINNGDPDGAQKSMNFHLNAALNRYEDAMKKKILVHDKPARPIAAKNKTA